MTPCLCPLSGRDVKAADDKQSHHHCQGPSHAITIPLLLCWASLELHLQNQSAPLHKPLPWKGPCLQLIPAKFATIQGVITMNVSVN